MTFSGTMEMTEHVLGVKAAGRLTTLNVKEGDLVKKGQLLATFDRFEQDKKDYARVGVLYKNGGADQQSLENAQLTMEDQQVISPLDGIVLVKSAETGEIIPAGGGVVVIGDPIGSVGQDLCIRRFDASIEHRSDGRDQGGWKQ